MTTSSNYYFETTWSSDNLVNVSEMQKDATIIDTKAPHEEWSDVVKASFNGVSYQLEDVVSLIKHEDNTFARIIEFGPIEATLRIVGTGKLIREHYAYFEHIDHRRLAKVRLNPNEAFRHRKKKRRF